MTRPKQTPRLSEMRDAYLAEKGHVSRSSLASLRSVMTRFVDSAGDRPAGTVEAGHVDRFIAGQRARGARDATLGTNLRQLRSWFRWMAAHGHVPGDPTAYVPVPDRKRPDRPFGADVIADSRAFMVDQRRQGIAPVTVRDREKTLLNFGLYVAPVPLREAATADLEAWLNSRPIGDRTRRTYLANLRAFYGFAVRAGWRADNPAAREAIRPPRVRRLLPKPIAADQLADAIRGAEPRMRAWLTLAGYAGLRCKEIAGLRVEDLLLADDPPVLIVNDGKAGHQRVVPVNPHVEAALRCYGLPRSGFVFTAAGGRQIRPATVSAYVARYLAGLGAKGRAHGARHSFATELYRLTRDLRLVQEMMGHADPQTTAIYAAFAPKEAAAAVRELGW